MGLEPQSLNNNVIQSKDGAIKDFSWLLKPELISDMVTA